MGSKEKELESFPGFCLGSLVKSDDLKHVSHMLELVGIRVACISSSNAHPRVSDTVTLVGSPH